MPPIEQTQEQRAAALRDAGVSAASLPISAPTPITYNVDAAKNPATLYAMPASNEMPDWRTALAALPTSSAIAGEQSPEQVAAATEQKSLQQRILDSLSGFGEQVGLLDKQTGQSDTQGQLDEIYGQIDGLQKEAQAIPLQVEEDSKGLGRTTGGIAPIEAGLVRTNAIKALGLSARASVLQGRLGAAKQQMDRLVQMHQSELDYLGKALEFNSSRMDDASQKQATQISIRLKERQDLLDRQRSQEDTVMQMLIRAKAAGAPDNLIAKAHGLDPLGAEGVLGTYLKDTSAPGFTLNPGDRRYDANGKLIAAAPPKDAGTPDNPFTQTQLNIGAAAAGMDAATFGNLDTTTKNFFINTFKSTQLSKDVAAVRAGGTTSTGDTKQQVARNVQGSNLPDSVKQAILAMLGVTSAEASTEASGGGFWSTIGSAIGTGAKFVGGLFGL